MQVCIKDPSCYGHRILECLVLAASFIEGKHKQEESYKKTIARSKWIIFRGLKTNQILMSAFFFIQNLNYPKMKNILFN